MDRYKQANHPPRTRRVGVHVVAGALLTIVAFSSGAARQDPAVEVGDARAILQEWVQIQREISKERKNWTLGREILNERIDLTRRQIESTRAGIEETRNNITELDKTHLELVNERRQSEDTETSLKETVIALERRLKELLSRLPDPIRDRVRPFSQQLPDDPDTAATAIGNRFMIVVGIMNDIDKFNREVTVTTETRVLPDGTPAQVTAMYLGLGQGYYVNAAGDVAGVGTSTPDGWVWKPANEAAPAITLAIAILQNEKPAEFVQLPVTIE